MVNIQVRNEHGTNNVSIPLVELINAAMAEEGPIHYPGLQMNIEN